jgi:hypothetical protein
MEGGRDRGRVDREAVSVVNGEPSGAIEGLAGEDVTPRNGPARIGRAGVDVAGVEEVPGDGSDEMWRAPLECVVVEASQPEVRLRKDARLKAGDLRFSGYSREKGLLPKVEIYRDWPSLVAGWKKELDALGAGFASGDARVDPKKLLQTCRYCDLQPLCRVYERVSALGDEGEDE